MMRRGLFIFALLWLARAAAGTPPVSAPLILISLDGFRWDYLEKYPAESPTLRALKRDGAAARGLIPVFPSNTFPNHYSIVTGLYPARHGIINNHFFDPAAATFFHYNQRPTASASHWWGGEPIWVTAIRQGHRAATAFWVGSDVEIAGVRPTFWQVYDYSIPFETRLDEVVRWLTLPAAERPSMVAFYFEETNGAGHRYGPDSPQVAAAVRLLDERVARMLARLRAEKIEPNLVLVSDHGMTATSKERVVILEDYVARDAVTIDADGSVLALRPLKGDAAALVQAFRSAPHVKAFLAEDLPAHFKLKHNPRIAPVWVLPDEGWHVEPRATFERLQSRYPESGYVQGDHGYDPALPSMHGTLIAHGPAFRRGVEIPPVENIHVYPLLCHVLQIKPAAGIDGDARLVKAFVRER